MMPRAFSAMHGSSLDLCNVTFHLLLPGDLQGGGGGDIAAFRPEMLLLHQCPASLVWLRFEVPFVFRV